MRFATVFAAVAATFVGFVAAAAEIATTDTANPLHAPLAADKVVAGTPFTITWSPNAGSQVTLVLRKGESGSLDTLEIIAKNLPNNGAFIWTPSKDLKGDTDYAIQILSEEPLTSNYTPQFKIDSSGKGIAASTTIQPTATVSVTATVKPTATYTGTASKPTDKTELEDLKDAGVAVSDEDDSAAASVRSVGMLVVAAVAGVVAVAL